METKHLNGVSMANKQLCLSLFLISVMACSGNSIKVSYDARSNALPTSKVNSTRNETRRLQVSPTPPITFPATTSVPPPPPTTTFTAPVTPAPPLTTNPLAPPASPTTPITTPTTGSTTWCVARVGVADASLQVALDYACGIGGADCSAIQPGQLCYNPNTVSSHASYAFNNYYHRNGLTPTSCDFNGTAQIANQDPSNGTCVYSTSGTGSSVLNTSNPTGGLGNIAPANGSDSSSILLRLPIFFTLIFLAMSIILGDRL